MIAKQQTIRIVHKLVVAGAAMLVLTGATKAQVQSQTKVEHGATEQTVKVERGEVVYVSGNDLVVKMEDGEIRHFPNVPDSARINVDGKDLSIHDLKPGMKLQKTTVTSTTPRMVTTVKTVSGKVFHVSPPNSVILTMENGQNQSFKIPKGQKFTIEGKETDAFGLKKGMKVSAQQVTESPETVVSHEVTRSGTMPPPPPAPTQDLPILIVYVPARQAAAEETAAAEPAPTKLPKTGSNLPLVGLLGVLLVALALGLKAFRTQQHS
jgi:LPXTG-motif cell wall-anchored protein